MPSRIAWILLVIVLFSCKDDDDSAAPAEGFFSAYANRNFRMGFSTWPFAPREGAVDSTYAFIGNHGDIYSEHIDTSIPWSAWINDEPLPEAFVNEINGRASRRIPGRELTVSVSLLNGSRTDLATDYDGLTPTYQALNDTSIENAYFKHLEYIAEALQPDHFVIAIEVNELLLHDPDKWGDYVLLMDNIRLRIEERFPQTTISESFTLHNLLSPDVADPMAYQKTIFDYANSLELVSVSFYPFFQGISTQEGFLEALNFLQSHIQAPIAFSETAHISEDLDVEGFGLFIPGSESEQKAYLETLLIHAREHEYAYVIWWTHRDYNELWETFPPEVQDLGELWLGSGLINEDGVSKSAFSSWNTAFQK